ncbi:hypothetical protein LTR17_026661 [Elasticomyces elasticus]|nr:hypothetical protein LTR17_026661 [Elasticomyces elasticus]
MQMRPSSTFQVSSRQSSRQRRALCKAGAEALKDIFGKTVPSSKDSRTERYKKAIAIKINSSEVKNYMRQVAKDIELLAQHQILQDAQTIEDIRAAIEQLDHDDQEETRAQSTHGSGDIINQSGSGTFNKRTYNSSGSSKMYAADKMHFGEKAANEP